ncbi:MAG: SAM-dependent methyltransferase [Pirellula sp.]|nr:SAM-dependent methyltransferase [Pirellula sp.]
MSVSSPSELDPRRRLTKRGRRGVESTEFVAAPLPLGVTTRWLRGRIISRLASLDLRDVEIADAAGVHAFGLIEKANDSSGDGDRAARIEVLDPRFYRSVACGGSLGFGRAYVDGEWTTPDLPTLLQRLARATVGNARVEGPATWPARIARTIRQLGRRNTRRGSRRNIHAHYDLRNEFFALFLDESMTYSSGLFEGPETTLAESQIAKYDRIAQRLQLNQRDHVVEIGCGWGGFAEHAASRYGCRVTGVTISQAQFDYARRRIAAAGLDDRVEIRLCDYRDLQGRYDKLASIEMIEAVGHEFLPTFFAKCSSLLKPTGLMMLQAITIPDQRYRHYRRSVDFIQEYVFPGGNVPSVGAICDAVAASTDLRLLELADFAGDYARTLLAWREACQANAARIAALGFDDRFQRTWDYYLCYCAAGFLERQIGLAHILLAKPQAR